MKKVIIPVFLAWSAMSISLKAQEMYNIQGRVIPAPTNQTMHLYHYKPGTRELLHDSCKVVNGSFAFKGPANKATIAFLTVPPDGMTLDGYMIQHAQLPKDQVGIYLEKGTIEVTIKDQKVQQAKVSGTPENEAADAARPIIWKYKNEEEAISKRLVAAGNDTEAREMVVLAHQQMIKERTKDVGAFIQSHPESLASLDLLKRWIEPKEDLHAARMFFAALSPALQHSQAAAIYVQKIKQADQISVGALAPDFAAADTTGTLHRLQDFKGKYVLVDFWASWCVPCRQENPTLIKAYRDFKSKNFEIISVSLDGGNEKSKQRWVDAIKKDGLTWLQLSDLQAWDSPIAKTYQISAIPMNFLIDPEGKIVAKNLRGKELTEYLSEKL